MWLVFFLEVIMMLCESKKCRQCVIVIVVMSPVFDIRVRVRCRTGIRRYSAVECCQKCKTSIMLDSIKLAHSFLSGLLTGLLFNCKLL